MVFNPFASRRDVSGKSSVNASYRQQVFDLRKCGSPFRKANNYSNFTFEQSKSTSNMLLLDQNDNPDSPNKGK